MTFNFCSVLKLNLLDGYSYHKTQTKSSPSRYPKFLFSAKGIRIDAHSPENILRCLI